MISITVMYFGVAAEEAETEQEVLQFDEAPTPASLKQHCQQKYSFTDPDSLQLAVNEELGKTGKLSDGDEVAFLPPFAGG